MNQIYRSVGISKQNVHQRLNRTVKRYEEQEQLHQMIGQIREEHPLMGARSLYKKIRPVTMGRDRFYDWYRSKGFTVVPPKNWRRTTDSSGVIRFKNLVQGIELDGINQVWVSDITYYELNNRFYYLTLVMDQYSRRIKGFCASEELCTEQTTLPAVKMALKYLRPGDKTIIHSDGGGQYYSKMFLALTNGRLTNSMGESAYENPHAERLNRTIKNSYLKGYRPHDFNGLKKDLARAVKNYNEGKPHDALNGITPNQFEHLKKHV